MSFGPYGSYIDAHSWLAGVATATVNGAAVSPGEVVPRTE